MSNIHIISKSGRFISALIHIDIPATNNTAGTPWRTTAIRNGYGTTALPAGDGSNGTISAVEEAKIPTGEVVEVAIRFKLGENPALADLDAAYDAEKTRFLSEFQATYNRYGMIR